MNTPDSAAVPSLDENALGKLGKMYRFARVRYGLLLLIPLLWLLGGAMVSLEPEADWVVVFLIIWFFVVLFGVAAWVFLLIPETEEIKRKYVSHVLPFLFQKCSVDINYYPSHDLSVNSLLKSGLYHNSYNTILREDCINGNASRMQFGMYQVAVQTGAYTMGAGRLGTRSRIMTNEFYGWVIHCVIAPVSGTHVILARNRKTSHESDDWLEKTNESWWQNPKCPPQLTGHAAFDKHFILYTSNPQVFFGFATKEFLDFVVYLGETTTNSFGINISGTLFAMHIGHVSPTFRHVPRGNFVSDFNPDLIEEVKWFSGLVKGVQKYFARPR